MLAPPFSCLLTLDILLSQTFEIGDNGYCLDKGAS